MPGICNRLIWTSGAAVGLGYAGVTLLAADAACASQGPGVANGTASTTIQLGMTILVYGASALVIAAALIGALRQR